MCRIMTHILRKSFFNPLQIKDIYHYDTQDNCRDSPRGLPTSSPRAPSAGVTLSLDKVTKTRGHSPF